MSVREQTMPLSNVFYILITNQTKQNETKQRAKYKFSPYASPERAYGGTWLIRQFDSCINVGLWYLFSVYLASTHARSGVSTIYCKKLVSIVF